MSLCVTVTGPPAAIWRRNVGMTDPLLPSTLPKRTAQNSVELPRRFAPSALACISISQMRFVAPITLVGLTALSVEISTNFSAMYFSDSSMHTSVPRQLLNSASFAASSIRGTCLCAAAWNTTCGLYFRKISSISARSRTEAISSSMSVSGNLRRISWPSSNVLFSYTSTTTMRRGP